MKKIVLVDGNNLMFRSYFATAYTGSIMRNSKGFPTNALYGFASMMNKIIYEEKPKYIAVAFDIGKNFRKEKYDFYKEGRNETPEDLKKQMPVARDLLTKMGIKYLELAPYEADDIIGTLVKMCELDEDFDATIISSDKDLLQLINYETDIKLLKKDSYIRYNLESFKEEWKIDPIRIIDLKALMGDASDNIPGVKGIGEKTALKLLQDYGSLEGVYENIESIKGATKTKLETDKANAFMSKEIATIYKDVPLGIKLNDLVYSGPTSDINELYKDLEFYSLLKKTEIPEEKIDYIITTTNNLKLENEVSLYLFLSNENYHYADVIKASLTDKNGTYILDDITGLEELLKNKNVIVYDYKKVLSKFNLDIKNDVSLMLYLLNHNKLDDLGNVMNTLDDASLRKLDDINNYLAKKSDYLFKNYKKYLEELENNNLSKLYYEIELPLVKVLYDMEKTGMKCNEQVLDEMGKEIDSNIENIAKTIYEIAGEEFNISSPIQLGNILFEKLGLPGGKKNKIGYKTDASVLEKLEGKHEIIDYILKYRNLSKLHSTYINGLKEYIVDGLIHPIFKQTLARTGRLSCTEPNLQNIPTRDEYGKLIRKAFVPQNDYYLSCDYSQIELRILAHISDCKELIDAFNNNEDIHTHVAADIYGIPDNEVTKLQRKTAKAVIFGIVYGISGYGLGDNLNISNKEAKAFIDKYYEMYPGVKEYMDNIAKSAREKGYVTTMFNRIRNIEEINDKNFMIRQAGERMAFNTPIQGSCADIIKLAMTKIHNRFEMENIQSKIVLQIHDELIFDCLNSELEKVKQIVKEEMENVVKLSVPIIVSQNVATNWYEV